MLRNINLQLFAEGDTIPEQKAEVVIENKSEVKEPAKKESAMDLFNKIFSNKKAEPEQSLSVEKPDVKPVVTPEPETKVPEVVKPEETKEPEFIPLKHLGKEVKLPVSERDKYLQKGLDYDFVKSEVEKAKARQLKAARLAGFSTVEEWDADLDNQTRIRQAEQIEEAAGDPEKLNKIITDAVENNPRTIEIAEKNRQTVYKEAKTQLSNDELFKKLESELDRQTELNPTMDTRILYRYIRGDYTMSDEYKQELAKEKELAAKEKETVKVSTEKKVIADIHDKERRSAPTGGNAADDGDNVSLTTEDMEIGGNFFGFSPKEMKEIKRKQIKGS